MLAASPGPAAAETPSPAIEISNDASSKQPTPPSNSVAVSSPGEDTAAENELLEAVNKSRELAGVPPLRGNESLRAAALAHAQRMVASERLEHQFSGEPSLLERIAQDGPVNGALQDALKIDRAGENIANASCAPGANEALMRSAPHKRNLLDREFNVVGMAAIWSHGRLYVVQDFAREVPSYSAEQSVKLVGRAVGEIRKDAGLPELVQLTPPNLDEAACSLARENRPNARLLATAYDNRKIITYTQSRPEVLPQEALRMLRDPGLQQFAVSACYARNAAYPTGTYWVAILLY
ncbi:MAG TPA: CAP domain-containing protein [Terriglobales bacterium]|nr:CAP domain-containing protein [Terriglobales bacterium]